MYIIYIIFFLLFCLCLKKKKIPIAVTWKFIVSCVTAEQTARVIPHLEH